MVNKLVTVSATGLKQKYARISCSLLTAYSSYRRTANLVAKVLTPAPYQKGTDTTVGLLFMSRVWKKKPSLIITKGLCQPIDWLPQTYHLESVMQMQNNPELVARETTYILDSWLTPWGHNASVLTGSSISSQLLLMQWDLNVSRS